MTPQLIKELGLENVDLTKWKNREVVENYESLFTEPFYENCDDKGEDKNLTNPVVVSMSGKLSRIKE